MFLDYQTRYLNEGIIYFFINFSMDTNRNFEKMEKSDSGQILDLVIFLLSLLIYS